MAITRALERGAREHFQHTGWELVELEKPTPEALAEVLPGCDGVVSMLTDRFDASLFAHLRGSRLKLIANHAVGVDNIDLQAAAACGIQVSNTPGVLTEATAEFTLTLLLALLRRLGEGERLVRSGQWQGWEPTQLLGRSIRGLRVGILGAGRIGQAFGRMAHALGAQIAYSSRQPKPDFEQTCQAQRLALPELLSQSEALSLHLPGGPETHHLIDAYALNSLPQGALLINTGRGTSVDQTALIAALQSGQLGGAALDVYACEPSVPDALCALENVVLAPHLGSATVATRRAMALTCLRNLQAVFQGQPAPHQVRDHLQE